MEKDNMVTVGMLRRMIDESSEVFVWARLSPSFTTFVKVTKKEARYLCARIEADMGLSEVRADYGKWDWDCKTLWIGGE